MKPTNLKEEKQTFFDLKGKYNPWFTYKANKDPYPQKDLAKPDTQFFKTAKKIIKKTMKIFKTRTNYFVKNEGPLVTKFETLDIFNQYIQDLGLSDRLDIKFKKNTIARTCMIFYEKIGYQGKPIGYTGLMKAQLPISYREYSIQGVLNHEIGTHFLRKYNEFYQKWDQDKQKYLIDIDGIRSTEEGLATLNQLLPQVEKPGLYPLIFQQSLYYYAAYQSSKMSFQDLYKDLEKYIDDPEDRWKLCVRVKRGLSDTSVHQGMYKDQAYLKGAIEILLNRKKINFTLLYSGKISLKDYQRLKKQKYHIYQFPIQYFHSLINKGNITLPTFLRGEEALKKYRQALDEIAKCNMIDKSFF